MRSFRGFFTPRDREWIKEGARHGWDLPDLPAEVWCWFGIRHSRALVIELRAYLAFDPERPDWIALWRAQWVAHAIRRGWA